jgi:hypothetical protein
MSDSDAAFSVPAGQRLAALSRWENEGGALEHADLDGLASLGVPPLSNTELVQLRIRVVALENLLLALLAEGTEAQTTLAKAMAAYILPREGYFPHPLTIHAAQQMLHLVERASRFRRSGK